jgi:type I restriction enzyme R subunit
MNAVGQIEKRTQARVVRLFRDQLGYEYLGNWLEREGNTNVETGWLRPWLEKRGEPEGLINRALYILDKAAGDTSKSLYERNRNVYDLLRYGVKVKEDVGENTQTVWLIDWEHPEANHFGVAEEVTVEAADPAAHQKRPDIVLYVNGIALGVLELKRSTISVSEGIRQNLDNQRPVFIEPFFATMQLVMAGNDTEGLRYGSIKTEEKFYLKWKDDGCPINQRLDFVLTEMCSKARLLELVHDFVAFDSGAKKLCRHNQYFGVKAAQDFVRRREGGIIWHTQGSGKNLTMVWLSKWLREHRKGARVLIITDRTELDEQIEKVFKGVNEDIYRTQSGADLIARLNANDPWLVCSLIHKFGGAGAEGGGDVTQYIEEVKRALPPDFRAKGDLYVFVDECHRTQSGELHKAMKAILPNALFFGFTGTPLLKADQPRTLEVFGPYIHTYKFDEAVRDGVIVDLRYEARDIDQKITSQAKIDQWFEAKTKGLTDLAKAQLKKRWGTMQEVLSSASRLQKIVADILLDMQTRDRLMSGQGNALLVSGSIYEACKFYELFAKTELAGKCAIITSYAPTISDIKGEETGAGATEAQEKYAIYEKMLADWFKEPAEQAVNKVEELERQVKKLFIDAPAQMKLLIVVDKLLTGFDAPSATYLYIDKQMQDHGLFQAICRVNRLDGESKSYGYVIDYKDLFKHLESAVHDYTRGAFAAYDKADVAGLLQDRLKKAKETLEATREVVKALCEAVLAPKNSAAYLTYFCAAESGNAAQLKENEPKRLALYKSVSALVRAYANLANELPEAGYGTAEIAALKAEVEHFEKASGEVKLASGDYIDLKRFEPDMRYLIDTYIQAEDSKVISAFDDLSLIELIVERGVDVVNALPKDIRKDKKAVAETIENNVRRLIIDEHPINPKYYDKMSELLDTLIEERRQQAIEYEKYLAKLVALTKQAKNPATGTKYPGAIDTPAKRALYDNLGKDEALAVKVDSAVRQTKKDGWRGNKVKERELRYAVLAVLPDEADGERVFELVKNQRDY